MPAYHPSEWQRELHRRPEMRKWVWAGRRGGKGRGALYEGLGVIEEASRTPFVMNGVDLTETLVPPVHVWTVGPNYGQCLQAWNEMKALIPPSMVYLPSGARGNRSSTGWNEDRKSVWLDLGPFDRDNKRRPRQMVFWEIKSADNFELLQTVGLDFLWMTESQDIKHGAWDKIRPILSSPGRAGRAVIEGIPPMNRMHWFSRGYWDARRNPGRNDVAITATTFDNPYLTVAQKRDVRDEKRRMTEAMWERMYMAVQPDAGGSFFASAAIDAVCGLGLVAHMRPRPGEHYVAGLDLGKQTDPTVLIIKNRRTRESVFALELLGADWNTQKMAIQLECARWNTSRIVMDSTGMGGDVLYDEFANAGLPVEGYVFTNNSKHQLFMEYAIALEKGTVAFPADWTKLREQLEGFEVTSQGQYFRYTQIDNGHDDWLDAEALALRACDPAMQDAAAFAAVRNRSGPLPPRTPVRGSRMMRRVMNERIDQWLTIEQEPPDLIVNKEPVRLPER